MLRGATTGHDGFPRKRETSNDFVVPQLREDSVRTHAADYLPEGGDLSDRIFDFLRNRQSTGDENELYKN